MRAVFLALIIVNAGLLVWEWRNGGVFFSVEEAVSAEVEAPVGNITLLSEGAERVQSGSLVDRARCRMVGPFLQGLPAQDFVRRLAGLNVQSRVGDVDVSQVERYWVYLEPMGSRSEALAKLRELQQLSIDSYVILKGKLRYGVSLGIFSRLSLAQEKVKAMTERGLSPLVEAIERTHKEHWVVLEVGEDRKIAADRWVDLLKEQPNLETRQSFCVLDLASKENFL